MFQQELEIDIGIDRQELWNNNLWETPDPVARYMASLILPTDKRILEPAAGTGQIAKFISVIQLPCGLIRSVQCHDINESCIAEGEQKAKWAFWAQQDFLSPLWLNVQLDLGHPFDLIITNPPFSKAIEFIVQSLQLLDRANPDARLIYLLPCDFFQSQERAKQFAELDCRIYQRHSIVGRVGYLKNGVAHNDRQIHDTIFVIKPGRDGDALPEKFVRLW